MYRWRKIRRAQRFVHRRRRRSYRALVSSGPGEAFAKQQSCPKPPPVSIGREPLEEAVLFPLRPPVGIRHALGQIQNDLVELRRRGLVHRLFHIVGWRVISLLQPILMQFLLGRTRQVTELERQRRNAFPDETVLIA